MTENLTLLILCLLFCSCWYCSYVPFSSCLFRFLLEAKFCEMASNKKGQLICIIIYYEHYHKFNFWNLLYRIFLKSKIIAFLDRIITYHVTHGCNNDRLFLKKYTVKDHISNTKLEKGDHYYIQTGHKDLFSHYNLILREL